jgi:hypothetical protein
MPVFLKISIMLVATGVRAKRVSKATCLNGGRQYVATDMPARRTLIFPAGMPRSLAYLEAALRDGVEVIGASSLDFDPARGRYPSWAQLPYVNTQGFDAALRSLIEREGITEIFTPNPVVWHHLHGSLPSLAPAVTLANVSPAQHEMEPYRAARRKAEEHLADQSAVLSGEAKPAMDPGALASLYRHAETIPGMCDHLKLRALCEIARDCPRGDLVEVGSWWGKSAFILLRLAQTYGIGRLYCVDPWSDAHLVQGGTSTIVDLVSTQYSAEEAFGVFLLNLRPYAHGDLSYLRCPSAEGAARYRNGRKVETKEFGEAEPVGAIALLHIDGNHSYACAKEDIEAWTPAVVPGGWIIIDDYVWPFGDGPRHAGDEYLEANIDRVAIAFVTGSALFIRLRT